MRRRHRGKRWGVAGLVLVALVGLGALAIREGRLATRLIGTFAPVDLNVPDGYFLDWRLAAMKSSRELCRRVVKAPHAVAAEIDDWTSPEGCGWSNGLRLASVGGVKLGVDKISCELTAALTLWIAHEVQPHAIAILGEPVASIEHLGGYACRNIRGSPAFSTWRSEHASANALDISAFVLAKGRRVSVLKHWAGETPEARFLRAIHVRACRYFRVAIGPDYNTAHRDHFHYDRGSFSSCR